MSNTRTNEPRRKRMERNGVNWLAMVKAGEILARERGGDMADHELIAEIIDDYLAYAAAHKNAA